MNKKTRWIIWIAGLIIFAIFPKAAGIYYSNIVVSMAVWALFAVSLNMLLGFTGLLSFGHAMYFGTGAYGAALALTHMNGLSFFSAMAAGCLCSVVLSLIVAPVVVRVSGTAFAMIHLAFAQCMFVLALKFRNITGGEDGIGGFSVSHIRIPGLFSLDVTDPAVFFYLSIGTIILNLLVLWFVIQTPFGQVMVGTRDNVKRVEYLGFRVSHTKAVVYVLAAGAAGVAGAVSAMHQNLVAVNDAYGMMISVLPIMIVMVGGARSFFGPIYGAVFFALLEEYVTAYTDKFELILGLILIIFIMYWPLGLAGIFLKLKFKWLTRKRFLKRSGGGAG